MFSHKLEKKPKSTVVIDVTLPWSDIQKEYKVAFANLQKVLQVEGFRKGKVPESIAQKHLSKESVYQEVVRTLIPKIYDDVLKKENLKPIVQPKVELVSAKENENWKIKISLAEKPLVDISKYKEAVTKAKGEAKKADIWVPGKGVKPNEVDEKEQQRIKQETLNKILGNLLDSVKIEIPDLIVEEELNLRLTKLLDDIQKIGLTADAYLKSKNTSMEQMKAGFRKEIEDTYKLEFILNEIADKEGIKVENTDLEKLFTAINDEKEKAAARQNSYFYASILRKQKTLDFIQAL